jgi:hypothetical protein
MSLDLSLNGRAIVTKPQADSRNAADPNPPERNGELKNIVAEDVLQALQGLQFGEVTITVRDGRIVQIERITRRRQIVRKQKE